MTRQVEIGGVRVVGMTVGAVVRVLTEDALVEDIDAAARILDDASATQRILAQMGRACGTCPLFEARERQWKNQVRAMIDNAMDWRD